MGDEAQEREKMMAELDRVKPTHVLNAAGVTGRPNVDWYGSLAPVPRYCLAALAQRATPSLVCRCCWNGAILYPEEVA